MPEITGTIRPFSGRADPERQAPLVRAWPARVCAGPAASHRARGVQVPFLRIQVPFLRIQVSFLRIQASASRI